MFRDLLGPVEGITWMRVLAMVIFFVIFISIIYRTWRADSTEMTEEQLAGLHAATREVLSEWLARLIEQQGDAFPEKVTAFRPEMAAHGKYGMPCPTCGDPIQRIVFAQRETNYCATCQTGGKLLADRALSRLLKGDWPRSVEELEAQRRG